MTDRSKLAFAVLICACVTAPVSAQDAPPPVIDFEFQGVIQPFASVTVANRETGVIESIAFQGGERVEAGSVLATMDDAAARIAVDAARAAVDEAAARLNLAEGAAARAAALAARGTGSRVDADSTEGARQIAAAALAGARAALASAELALSHMTITAPIAGTVGPPQVAPGAFVEAEAGAAIGEIMTLDPVRVAYGVPYTVRQRAMAATGATGSHSMFERLRIRLVLPDGSTYPHDGRPRFESGAMDPATGLLTSWGEVPNPDGTLVPGLRVTVQSWVVPAPGVSD